MKKKKYKEKRWRRLADLKIQGQISVRIIFYWMVCQIVIFGTLGAFGFLVNEQGSIRNQIVPAAIVSLLFLPIVIFDMLKFSNKFVGPMVNLRNTLERIKETGSMERIRVRKDDCHQELVELINEVMFKDERATNNEEAMQNTTT